MKPNKQAGKKVQPTKPALSRHSQGKSKAQDKPSGPKFMAGLVILMLCFSLYANTLSHKYALDDFPVIYGNNLTMQGVAGIPMMLKTAYWYGLDGQNDFLYRPLSLVTYAVEWQISPKNPHLGHWVNVLLYMLTCLLLFNFLSRLLYKYNLVIPFAATLLFIAHPLHTEVVANIKSRDEILCFLFLIISGNALLKYLEKGSWVSLLSMTLSFFLALMSKETAITFLFIYPMLLFFFREIPMKKIFLYASMYAGVALVYLLIRGSVLTSQTTKGAISIIDNTLVIAPDIFSRLATAFYILGLYIKLLVYPHSMSSDYSYPQIPIVGMGNPLTLIAIIFYGAIFIYACMRLSKKDILSFCILYFLVPLSLVSNVFFLTRSTMADRFLYIPSLGFCIAFAWILQKLLKQSLKPESYRGLGSLVQKNASLFGILAVVIVLYSFKTIDRNKDWKSDYTLFSKDSQISSNSARIHFLFANHLIQSVKQNLIEDSRKPGFLDTAEIELNTALRLYPAYYEALFGLGEMATEKKNDSLAIACYQRSLAARPNDSRSMNNLGNAWLRRGDFEKAFEILNEEIKLYPRNMEGFNNLGAVYFNMRKYTEASENYKKALDLNPNYIEAAKNLGSCYGMMKEYDNAITYFQKASALEPDNPDEYSMIGITYKYKGDSVTGQSYLDKARELQTRRGGK